MVSLSPGVDARDAAALRETAEEVAAASADIAAQIEQLAALDQRHLTLLADTAHGPIRVTLATDQLVKALDARLAQLDTVANALRRDALAAEREGCPIARAMLRRDFGLLGEDLGRGLRQGS